MTSKKHVLMLFSGGLDSTYLLQKNLEQGNQVSALYVKLCNNDQWKSELRAIDRISKIFNNDYPDKLKVIKGDYYYVSNGGGDVLVGQMPGHMMFLVSHLKACIDEVQIGYVCGDHGISFSEDLKKIWKSYAGLFPGGKIKKLTFPLIKTTKEEVWDKLDSRLESLISFCENPTKEKGNTYTPCGNCDSCIRMKGLLSTYPSINEIFFNGKENNNV